MKHLTIAAFAASLFAASGSHAQVVLDWSTVGNPDNAPDADGFGSVGYEYRISTYEVTNSQYTAFLNSVAASDPNGLYNPNMSTNSRGGIGRSGSNGSYTYFVRPNMGDKPVNYVSWYDAARMANWMTNGQGLNGSSGDTETGVYNFDGSDSISAITRDLSNPDQVFIPTEDEVTLNVTNHLMDTKHSSIHWHGILVPFSMDGVPGVNFRGIPPGESYEYRYRVKQAGTYWYHSHSFLQEQSGTYGPLIIDPADGEPFAYDRDYVMVLSDWSFEKPETIFRHINLLGHYYNFQQRTVGKFFRDVREHGFKSTLAERMAWGKMRMSPVDLAGVTGATYTYLMNGNSPDMNWTALFDPGDTVRLRVINASAMSNFDVRIPGLEMDVVMADGKAVRPVRVQEFRIGVAETYDVLVRPTEDRPFTLFAESLDRSGHARGTLSPEPGLEAPVPERRPRPVRQLDDIGMGMMADKIFGGSDGKDKKKMKMSRKPDPTRLDPRVPGPNGPEPFLPDRKTSSNVAMIVKHPRYRLDEPGIGLGNDGRRVLTYADLVSDEAQVYAETPDREMTINITANMERYMFSFDGKKFTEHPGPYLFRHNERLRLFLVNHTMMDHPIHLHGMWMQLENGAERLPYKHTVLVKPGEALSALITPIEQGDWAFHCHLLYHMEAGMFQVVRVA